MPLSHLDDEGRAKMVDVSAKEVTLREAVAVGEIAMQPETLALILAGEMPKGAVLSVARVAGIMAAKRTADLIPMCHPLPLTEIAVDFEPDRKRSVIHIRTRVSCRAVTGVEMEALTAASVAALTIYDMCKAVDRGMSIQNLHLQRKTGGKSGDYIWEEADAS